MDQSADRADQLDYPPFFIFTNSQGLAFFSDLNFIRVRGIQTEQIISGRSLSRILIIDVHTAGQLRELVKQKSRIGGIPIPFITASGSVIQADTTAVAALDENGNFMGMDLVLANRPGPSRTADKTPPLFTHADVIKAYVEMEMSSRDAALPRTFIQSYLVAQFNVVQILLARIGGLGSRLTFERITNSTASSMRLPVRMENGHLNFSDKDVDIQGYRSLLQKTMDYAVDVVGRSFVRSEMLLVDSFVGHGTLELISQMDLRIFSAE